MEKKKFNVKINFLEMDFQLIYGATSLVAAFIISFVNGRNM